MARAARRGADPCPVGVGVRGFEASRRFGLFDSFRVPYDVCAGPDLLDHLPERHPLRNCAALRLRHEPGRTRFLYWVPADEGQPSLRYQLGDAVLFGRLLPDAAARSWLTSTGTAWRPIEALLDEDGRPAGSLWGDDAGSVFLPFDPDELITNFLTERYQSIGSPSAASRIGKLLRSPYYAVRPALPRELQIRARRIFARVQARAAFPRWPVEPSLHDLSERLLGLCASVAGEPLPTIGPWPEPYRWAFVLTHDVETQAGYDCLHLLRDLECAARYRSAWYFVPRRYEVDAGLVAGLVADGFEVGVHGLYHDGKDLSPSRANEIRRWGEHWGARGFRAPALHHDWATMPQLGFDYDSSYPDSDPYGPQPGGCGSWLPFFNQDLVELPVTLPQDHGLFVILRRDGTVWHEKAQYLRKRNGMALLITHPDYMRQPERLAAYAGLLEDFREDETVWKALPYEVSGWWRRRADSRLERQGDSWSVVGPAAGEGRVHLVGESRGG